MRNYLRLTLVIGAAAAMLGGPSMAAENKRDSRGDEGVQQAIAYQRAKDRADAAQARKEARHPEHLTPAAAKPDTENKLADEQRRETLERSGEKSADRETQPPK